MKVTPTASQQPICAKKRALPLRDTEHTKAAGNIRSWQEKHIQGTAFHIFCARSPLSGTGTESPGNITVSLYLQLSRPTDYSLSRPPYHCQRRPVADRFKATDPLWSGFEHGLSVGRCLMLNSPVSIHTVLWAMRSRMASAMVSPPRRLCRSLVASWVANAVLALS